MSEDDVPGRDRLPWSALLVTGPCVTAMIDAVAAGTSEAKTGPQYLCAMQTSTSPSAANGTAVKKSLGGGGYETSGSELTAIHEGVDVALRQRFFQTVLRGALSNEIILVLKRG